MEHRHFRYFAAGLLPEPATWSSLLVSCAGFPHGLDRRGHLPMQQGPERLQRLRGTAALQAMAPIKADLEISRDVVKSIVG